MGTIRCVRPASDRPRHLDRVRSNGKAVFRFKALVGVKLTARKFENQQVEALVKCRALNRMASLGMPRLERARLG